MKIVLEVQNVKKSITPSKDNIIIYDGESWYVTTKSDLFKEYDERFEEKIKECEEQIETMNQYKKEISQQMLDIKEIIQNFVELKEA